MSESIKKIVGEEKYTELSASIGEDKFEVLDKILTDFYKPKVAVDEIVARKNQLKTQVSELTSQFEALKASTKGNEELEAKILEIQTKATDWETKYQNTMFENAVKMEATREKARDVGDIMAFIKKDTLIYNNDTGVLEGLSTQLTELKKIKPYLFDLKEETPSGSLNPHIDDKTKTKNDDALRKLFGL